MNDSRPDWVKSSYSNDGNCVEVARSANGVAVRDTKDKGTGPILTFTAAEWDAFLSGAQSGEFGRPVR